MFDLGSASHELRAPLHAILGLAELLVGGEISGTDRELASRIQREARAMEIVLADILQLSRLESTTVVPITEVFSPRVVAGEATSLHQDQAAAKGLVLRVQIAEDTPLAVRGDRYRLRQILVNLVSNAVKYTSAGSVTVDVKSVGSDAAPQLELSVIDTGPGIPDAAMPSLFLPFTQARSGDRDKGTGLGLAITQRLVDAMGASLNVETGPTGTIFCCSLPFLPARRMQDREISTSAASASRSVAEGVRILVVDDTEVNRLLATSQLERLGYQAIAVASGAEALLMMADEPLDAVLMDWHMPGLDGLEATRKWREHSQRSDYDGPNRDVPIIAVTASALASDRSECLAAGMNDYLAKPTGLEVLGACLRKWLPFVDASSADPTSRATPPSVDIDPDRISSLRNDLGAEAVHAVVTAFLGDLPQRVTTMEKALAEGDRAVIRRTAHTVKSSAALFGAGQLEAAAASLESAAAESGELDALTEDFLRLVPLTAVALNKELASTAKLEGSTL